jgi:hypothetical protein
MTDIINIFWFNFIHYILMNFIFLAWRRPSWGETFYQNKEHYTQDQSDTLT